MSARFDIDLRAGKPLPSATYEGEDEELRVIRLTRIVDVNTFFR